jgi:hypothetical protein
MVLMNFVDRFVHSERSPEDIKIALNLVQRERYGVFVDEKSANLGNLRAIELREGGKLFEIHLPSQICGSAFRTQGFQSKRRTGPAVQVQQSAEL